MLFLFLCLHALAASEVLHRDFHEHGHCHHTEETCVVSVLAHGGVEPPLAEVPLPRISTVETFVTTQEIVFVGYPVDRLRSGRAPPVLIPA